MASSEDIEAEKRSLEINRRNLRLYLAQRDQLGSAQVTPAIFNGIIDTRENIERSKATLRAWGISVDDRPYDAEPLPAHYRAPTYQAAPPGAGRMQRLLALTSIATIIACIAVVGLVPEVRRLIGLNPPPATVDDGAGPTAIAASVAPATAPASPAGAPTRPSDQPAPPTAGPATAAPAAATVAEPSALPQTESIDLGGTWSGYIAQPNSTTTDNFKITLTLTQKGSILLGESRVEKIGNPRHYSRYHVTGKVSAGTDETLVVINDTDNIESSGLSDSAASIKRLEVVYTMADGNQYLSGGWFHYTNSSKQPTGMLKVVKQRPDGTEPSFPIPAGLPDLNGTWAGLIVDTSYQTLSTYNITLEIEQHGEYITGVSRVEEIGDSKHYATYQISGQVFQEANAIVVRVSTTDYIEVSRLTDHAASIIHMHLTYDQARAGLDGAWLHYTSQPGDQDGEIHLNRS